MYLSQVPTVGQQTVATQRELEVQVEQFHEGEERLLNKNWVRIPEQDDEAMLHTANDSNMESDSPAAAQTDMPHPDSSNDQVISGTEEADRQQVWVCELCQKTQQSLGAIHKLIVDEEAMKDVDVCGSCCDCQVHGSPCNPSDIERISLHQGKVGDARHSDPDFGDENVINPARQSCACKCDYYYPVPLLVKYQCSFPCARPFKHAGEHNCFGHRGIPGKTLKEICDSERKGTISELDNKKMLLAEPTIEESTSSASDTPTAVSTATVYESLSIDVLSVRSTEIQTVHSEWKPC